MESEDKFVYLVKDLETGTFYGRGPYRSHTLPFGSKGAATAYRNSRPIQRINSFSVVKFKLVEVPSTYPEVTE